MNTPKVVKTNPSTYHLPEDTTLYELVKINLFIHLRDNLVQAENIVKLVDEKYKSNKEKYKVEAAKYKHKKRQNDYILSKWRTYQNERDFYTEKVLVYKTALWKLKSNTYSVEDYKILPTYLHGEWKTYLFLEDKRDYDLWLLFNEEKPELEPRSYNELNLIM